MTVSDLAKKTGLSISMVSRMETGTASPSINTLRLLSHALSAPLVAFFRSYEKELNVQFEKARTELDMACAQGPKIVRRLILKHNRFADAKLLVEPYHVVLTEESALTCDASHDGAKLIYILAGELIYRYGSRRFQLSPGDSLFFYAGIEHGPDRVISPITRYLSVSSTLRK